MNFTPIRKLLPIVGCVLGLASAAFAGSSDVMIEGFDWGSGAGWWTTLQNDATTLHNSGFTMVWFPPCTKTADSHGYMPTQWYDLNDSPYGNQSALVGAINAVHGQQMKAIADIVINHRCGDLTAGADFSNPVFGEGQGSTDSSNPNNARAVVNNDECGCGTGASDTGVGYASARDLDHTWSTTQSTIETWMNWLKSSIGFDGWRYDMVTGYGPSYVGIYNGATSPYFSVGEYWDTNTTNENNWANNSGSPAFDFATKNTLDSVFNNNNYSYLSSGGSAPGLIGVNPSKAVTFVDNHDTAATGGQSMLPMPSSGIQQAYVYILTHPGVPCVFWDQYWNNQSLIGTLISIRKQQGITSTSSLSIQTATTNVYAAIINGNTAMKIGPGAWSPSGSWTLATSGTNYAVWTQATTQSQAATPTFSLASGAYTGTQSLTLSDSTPGATIYYTTNGSTPTTSSTVYTGIISVSTSETVNAIAAASGYSTSGVATATYTISTATGGSLTGSGSAVKSTTAYNLTSLGSSDWAHWGQSSATAFDHKSSGGSQISNVSIVGSGSLGQFTDSIEQMTWSDGTPTASASSSPNGVWVSGAGNGVSFTAPADTTQRTLTVYVGGYQSAGTLTASLSDGSAPTYTDSTMSSSGTGTDGSHYYATYTLTYKAASAGQTITVKWTENANQGSGNVTLQAATLSGGTTAAATPTFSPAGGAYTSAQSVTISDATSGATIYYTTDGSTPTTSSTKYTGAITVGSSETVKAIATASGYSTSAVGSATYTINTSNTVAVTFEIQNCNTTFGQNVYVVGNISQLGNWTPANGFKLTIQGSGSNVPWMGTINLPANTAIQYKYVKWNGTTAVWEANQPTASGNREITTPSSGSITYNDGNF